MSARRALTTASAPDEAGAEDRAWAVVREAYAVRPHHPAKRSRAHLVLAGPLLAALAIALVLSPAGASVRSAISRALSVAPVRPIHLPKPLTTGLSLPAPGRLLVSGAAGTWTVAADGSKQFLGAWSHAAWSPRGINVVVAGHNELAAVSPTGRVEWPLWSPAGTISDPRWYAPSGYRVAYLAGSDLRVVAGDGPADRPLDHLVAAGVQAVAPAWRPASGYELAYSAGRGSVVVREADSGRLVWQRPAPGIVRALQWSDAGSMLLALTSRGLRIYDARGDVVTTIAAPVLDAAISPDGQRLAFLRRQEVVIRQLSTRRSERLLLSAAGLRQVVWSPDGRWLLLAWPAADEWLFARAVGKPEITGVGRVTEQLSAGAFPTVDGWCCTSRGGTT